MDLYAALGLSRSATPADIKGAYKRAALQHHPDRGGDAEEFKRIQRAYEVLGNDDKRRTYDLTGSEDGGGVEVPMGGFPFNFDIGNMFGMFGSPGPKRRQRGEKAPPKVERVSLSLSQFYHGHKFELRFERQKFCDPCGGKGWRRQDACGDCRGSGSRTTVLQMGPISMMQVSGPCDTCNGSGAVGRDKCGCSGGRIANEKVLEAVVRPGMKPGDILKFEEACSDTAEYERPGDVHIILEETEDDDGYIRKGQHLEKTVVIGLGEALVGTKLTLTGHPKGEPVTVELGPATMNMERFMYRDLGFIGSAGAPNGNLYITVQVQPKAGEREKIRDEARGYLASLFGMKLD
jgi:DnaJ family protein A protein 2